MPPYAHTHPQHPDDPTRWEPLFTSFGDGADECQRHNCQKCANLAPYHGHLNKVAWWTAKFAAEMFPENSEELKSAHQWGYLTGLWHDLGKFAPEWQNHSKFDPASLATTHRSRLLPYLTGLGEASTTEIAKKKDAQGFPKNHKAAKAGGTNASNARKALETQSGQKISTPKNQKALTETKKRIPRL